MVLHEADDHWVLLLAGRRIARSFVDSGFGVEIEGDDEITVRIEGAFSLDAPAGRVEVAEGHASKMASELDLSGAIIESAIAFKDGALRLRLSGKRCITVGASLDYEPWEIADATGLLVVSVPGGELAIWSGLHRST